MKLSALAISLPLLACVDELPWRQRHAEGWAWYHDRIEQKEESVEEAPPLDPIIILKSEKEELDRSLAKAMLEPTEENVVAYMALQQRWIKTSGRFSHLWQQALLQHPELASLNPTAQYAVQVRKEVDRKATRALIQDLAGHSTLLFFYEGGNAYSQAFGNVIKEFTKQYHWTVQAVSVDGIRLSSFPKSLRDRSIADEMNIHFFPALFLVEVSTLKAVPLAFGMVTISQIEENIKIQFQKKVDL